MPLSAGTRLGPYEILAPIGAGGMGEVYKARDTRLGRDVAIKVAKEQFSERFDREARAIAQLNHPHICQLYDVGPNYLVMELLEGTPLKGPLPLEKAIEYAGQILDALDAAHKKSITHRDLKPANILVTKQGIKLLDFGLAKQTDLLQETDITRALTGQGQILGTLQYMSPEQLQGKEVDARSDLFSFGCVLYEMLTGKRAFEGESPASVIAAILEREPAPLEVARPLDRVIKRSLAKDPDQRFQTARDLKAALAWALEQPPQVNAPSRSRLGWAVAGALGLALIALGALYWRTRTVEQPLQALVRLDIDLGSAVSLGSQAGADVILSPDGGRLVYLSQNRLLTRRLDQPKATELTGTEGAYSPFFSPDGEWVAFFAGNRLKKVSVAGGSAIVLCDASGSPEGGSWGEDGNIIAALNNLGTLVRIPASGGPPTPLTGLEQGEINHRWPQILPGGKAVLFTSHGATTGFDGADIEVMSFASHHRKILVRGGTFGRYLPSGHLVYVNRGTLFAVTFDLERLEVHGTPTPVLEEVVYSPISGSAQLSFSRMGSMIYRSGRSGNGLVTMQWLDSTDKIQPLLAKAGLYWAPRLSPDGQRVALQATEGSSQDIWVYEWQRDTMARLTFGGGTNVNPVWSPDGRYLAFREPGGMFWIRADGTGGPQPLTHSKNLQLPWSFTPNGKRLAVWESSTGTGNDLWTVPLESDGVGLRAGKPEVFLQTPADERYPFFSPDGQWLAYASDESGTFEVYVRSFPDRGGKWQISNSGGVYPVWSRNRPELFFRSLDNRIMVASYTVNGHSFVADRPRLWSEKRLVDFGTVGVPTYDLAPDGKRIVALMPAGSSDEPKAQNHLIFLENFFDELRRRLPVGK